MFYVLREMILEGISYLYMKEAGHTALFNPKKNFVGDFGDSKATSDYLRVRYGEQM